MGNYVPIDASQFHPTTRFKRHLLDDAIPQAEYEYRGIAVRDNHAIVRFSIGGG